MPNLDDFYAFKSTSSGGGSSGGSGCLGVCIIGVLLLSLIVGFIEMLVG